MSLLCLYGVSLLNFTLAVTSVAVQYKHVLMILLSLEGASLSCFVLLLCVSNGGSFSGYMCLVFISLAACEASLGLSVLVYMIRMKGNDYVMSFSSH
uniref:NADH-ubiquinone oxidoreductase chain 4L n=1 Tax=Epitonium scalare TaxID=494602 RepID=A0A6B9MU92_9CAEN|nr:NADH dehydrogenase subunit 4L [Epitonium scalare]